MRSLVTKALKRAWIPLVLIVVLTISGFGVARLHRIFGSQDLNADAGAGIEIVQFNPKVVTYEVFGPREPPRRSTIGTPKPIRTKSMAHPYRGPSPSVRSCPPSAPTSWCRATAIKSAAASSWMAWSATKKPPTA